MDVKNLHVDVSVLSDDKRRNWHEQSYCLGEGDAKSNVLKPQ